MDTHPEPILEIKTRCLACDVQTYLVHHRTFPELQVEGLSADEAAKHLVNRLSATLEGTHIPQEREAVEAALAEARSFLDLKGLGQVAVGRPSPEPSEKVQNPPPEVIDAVPSPTASGSPARLLGKGRSLEVRLLTLPEGKAIPEHSAAGEITVHCLKGRIAFTTCGATYELGPGQLLIVPAGEPHSLVAREAASAVVTKQNPGKPAGS